MNMACESANSIRMGCAAIIKGVVMRPVEWIAGVLHGLILWVMPLEDE